MYEDVVPALDLLASKGLKLGIVSNLGRAAADLSFAPAEIGQFFEVIMVSWEVGFAKPSPVIYEQAVRKLALPPENILHVGDSQELDVTGARAAGLNAVLLRRVGQNCAPGQIHSLGELDSDEHDYAGAAG